MTYKILFVDDEPANLRMMERLFRDEYEVLTADSGPDALEALGHYDIALIVSDQRMPGMTGIEFLTKAAVMRPQTVRIILTGYTDVKDLVEAINSGVVYKYLTKPWINADLLLAIQRGVEHYEVTKKGRLLAHENERLESRLEASTLGSVNVIREMIVQKSSNLGEHCRRTSEYAARIGSQFDLDPDEMGHLISAALLHEFPNIRIPFEMDFDKTALTVGQHQVTRNTHENGVELIAGIPDLEDAAVIIRHQHEQYDGSGFFEGLDGEKIPLMSRILAVANAFDEINSGRNPAIFCSNEEIADWFRKRAGNRFDPTIVEACLEMDACQRFLPEPADHLPYTNTLSARMGGL